MAVLRVLLIDDSSDDTELLLRELRRNALTVSSRRVADPAALREALADPWDLVICDWSMPGFDGLSAFKIVRELDQDVPFIIASGTVDEEIAVAALKAGVHDFVAKHKLTRLVPAIHRELREAEVRRKRRQADAEVTRQRELVARGEDRYRALFDNSPLPMWTFDRDTLRFVTVNDAAVRHYGYTRDEFLAMTLADIRPSADLSALQQDVAQSRGISEGKVWRHRKKDGALISVEVRASDLVVDGKRMRLAVINDVTERERPTRRPLSLWIAFAALVLVAVLSVVSTDRLIRTMDRAEHSHELLNAFESVAARFGDVVAPGANAQAPQRLAAALSEARHELSLDLNVDDESQLQRFARLEAEIAARNVPAVETELDAWEARTRSILENQHRDTARQVLLERIVQLAAMLLSIAILWFIFSRLAREARLRRAAEEASRQSEESLATMLHSIGDGVIASDRDGKIVRMNRVAEELTGWAMSEAVGRKFDEVFRITDNAVLVTRAGAETPIAHSTAPIRDAAGNLAGSVVVFRDVSAERRHAEQLRTLNEELERRVVERTAALQKTEEQLRQSQKIEAIGRLAGGIAHDFNNLLSVIISFSELMVDDAEKDRLPQHVVADLDEIKKAGLRAADLTRQLLAFSRQQVLAPKILDLNDIVAGMEKLLRRVIGADIQLRSVRATDAAKVKVDPGQIEQVIMNLVVNARDAMPRGGKLTIEVSRVELDEAFAAEHHGVAAGPYIQLAVTDTGSGMSKEVQAQIFEPFFTTKEKGKGTGLGLSTVFGIVQQSGGTIWVYSEPGKGTTFKVYLPASAEAQSQLAAPAPKPQLRGTETILVVEDEPQVRSIARGILTRAGYTVLEAEHGAAALELCERTHSKIDLVLTDVVMPVMSGRELVEKLGAVRPGVKVLFMSGYTDDTVVHHGVVDRGVAFLQKPIMPDALAKKVREVLDASGTSTS